ncbi:MAG TPA: UDP-glucose/GDP-mannose dehydrogenase family protein [Bacilli bacterium]
MKQITILGTGYVGLVSGACFAEIGNQVIYTDIDHARIARLQEGEVPFYEPGLKELVKRNTAEGRIRFTCDVAVAIAVSEIIFIAVGTPMSPSGEADLTHIRAAAQTIGEHLNGYKVIVNKSTVPVGTGRWVHAVIQQHLKDPSIEFDVVANPEFLREGSAIFDCMHMDRAIIGTASPQASRIIEELHAPFGTTVFTTDRESAEMIKYASNAFLATKISFINAIAHICEGVDADVTKVAEGMGLDSRIGGKFLLAGLGFGGSCFPKDTHAIVHMAERVGYDFALMKAVIATNDQQRLVIVRKLEDIFVEIQGLNIAVLGLAFKPNTDDLRCAPSLDIISVLLALGAVVWAYDPVALEGARKQLSEEVTLCDDVYETVMDCDACLIVTEWNEVRNMDLAKVRNLMRTPIVIDGRNCFGLEVMKSHGFIYHSIGRAVVE